MHLRMAGISKRFGALTALDAVDFEARAGEVTALLGENGAGKSTLMKILYGVHRADAGVVSLDGTPLGGGSPREAVARGVGMVFQQFSLIAALSVRENLALAQARAPWWLGRGARRLPGLTDRLHELAPDIDADLRVSQLSVGQMQLVELAKVLNLQARVIVLDEPTAVLAPDEAQRLWARVRMLREGGLAVVLITHKLQDVHACADRIVVLRGGRQVASESAAGLDDARIVQLMVGTHAPALTRAAAPQPRTRLWIRRMSAAGDAGQVCDIELELRAGELMGVAGVSGNGQTTLAEAVAGIAPLNEGEVILDGELLRAPRHVSTVAPSAASGVAYIPEQPLRNAVVPDLSLALNLALRRIASLPFFPARRQLAIDALEPIARYDVRPAAPDAPARSLSGGNLQKLVAARELAASPAVIVACYPTMGLDVTAAARIYEALFELARSGSAVLWISEDLGDLLRFSDRIAVMAGGRVVKVLETAATDAGEVGAWMTGSRAEISA